MTQGTVDLAMALVGSLFSFVAIMRLGVTLFSFFGLSAR